MDLSKLTCASEWLDRFPKPDPSPSAQRFILFLLAALFLSGCVSMSDPEASQVHEQEVVAVLQPGGPTLRQTFISRRAGLNGLTLWLGSEQGDAQGSLQIELFHSNADPKPVYQAILSTSSVSAKRPFSILFPALDDPPGQAYNLRLLAAGKSLQVFGRSENIYPPGELIVGEAPVQADLAFRTTYDYGWFHIKEDLYRWVKAGWLVIPLGLLLLIPGWLLLDLVGFFHKHDLGEKIALSLGFSLGIIPVVMLWTTAFKLSWSPSAIWFALGMLSAILLVRLLKRFRNRPFPLPFPSIPYPLIALFVLFLLSLAVRLAMVRDYATPAWVDSVHHGMITRLILEQGGYPASYAPFVEIEITEYHPGFHSLLAAFTWLSGLSIDQAMLILGQVLNALVIFSAYLFSVTLLSDRRAGLIAAALAGLFTPMPAYYTSWGRYTHLVGMLVLPIFFSVLKILWDHTFHHPLPMANKGFNGAWSYVPWKPIIFLSLISGGLFLIHYRIAGFASLLALAFLVFHAPLSMPSFTRKIATAALSALGAILLILPWFLPALTQTLVPRFSAPISRQPFFSGFTWQYLTAGLGTTTLVLALFGLILGLALRRSFAFTLLLWIALLFILPNLSALGLPGGYLVNQTAVEISLFLPISVLGGFFISQAVGMVDYIPRKVIRRVCLGGLLLLSVPFLLLGAQKTLTILNPVTVLSRQPDLPALAWMQANLPEGETVLINPFLWGYGIYAGSDGGYWITPLTGHPTLPPPVLYGVSSKEITDKISQLCAQVIEQGQHPAALADLLQQNGIRYVYLGARGGVISPSALLESSDFHLRYQAEGSWVYEVGGANAQNSLTDSSLTRIIP